MEYRNDGWLNRLINPSSMILFRFSRQFAILTAQPSFLKSDIISFLSKLSLKKLRNTFLVFTSYYLSRLLGRPIHWGLPMTISIEPTTSCNLRCPECPSGLRSFSRPTGMLDEAFYKKTIDELHDHLLYLYFYFQGEPFLHPHFIDLVKYASNKGIYTVTSTNAHFLDEEKAQQTVESGLDRIIISIDGFTQETYESYRVGGQLKKVLRGTKNLVAWKRQLNYSKPYVIFQFLVVKPNEHQIEKLYDLAAEIGVDEVKLKTAQIYDYANGSPLMPSQAKYSRYKKLKDGTYRIKNKLLDHCWKMWHSCVITWDGKIVPCCFDKDAQHVLGDLKKQSLKAAWNSNEYQAFRTGLMTSRKEIDICKNCTEGMKVWA